MSLLNQNDDSRYAQRRILDLKMDLGRWNEQYRTGKETEVTDRQFDLHLQELRDLEALFPDLATEDSPTKVIGAEPPTSWPRVKHTAPMLSIENVFTIEALEEGRRSPVRRIGASNGISILTE